MTYFYKKDGEVFIPEKINPDLVRFANTIVKNCKLSLKLQLKTTAINNALKNEKREQMLDVIQKCFAKNKKTYDMDMALTGVTVEEVEDNYFDDKDNDFIKAQLHTLYDFAVINTVIENKLMNLLSATCEKVLGTPIDKIKFFTNQTEILEIDEDEFEGDEE